MRMLVIKFVGEQEQEMPVFDLETYYDSVWVYYNNGGYEVYDRRRVEYAYTEEREVEDKDVF